MATTNLIAAGKNDFLVYEGDTTPVTLAFTKTLGSVPIALTGASVVMQIRKRIGGDLVDTFSTGTADITIGGASGNVLTVSGWERLPYGRFVYDLQVTLAGSVTTYLTGKIKVTREITT